MATASLTQRLQALADTYKQTLNLIHELQRFPNSSLFADDPDEKRLEIGNEIHENLAEQEDTLEFLRQELGDESAIQGRRSTIARTQERDRNAATISRLTEDFKNARGAFRKAQLQAKRNADAAKKKEREELFAERTTDLNAQPKRRKGQEKLTQDELALNAAEDVTRSLRRAHELLAGNLSQSLFAQQTLDESSEALRGLSESYGGTTDLLKSSRGLVGQLLKSQKSDTWFLMSSTYIMVATIAWLVFRRLLYGPLWWLVYQPLKLMWWSTFVSLGAVGFGSSDSSRSSSNAMSISSTTHGIPTRQPGVTRAMNLPPKGAGWHREGASPEQPQSPEMVEQVSKIIDDAAEMPTGVQEPVSEGAKNTKKRMMEHEREPEILRDEL